MDKNSIPTGQVIGLTGIPGKAIERYVREFRSFFSETAAQRTRGRRFTAVDINNLLMIRQLYYQRYSPDQIRAALAGEWIPPALPTVDKLDLVTLAAQVHQQAEQTDQAARAAQQAARENTHHVDLMHHEFQRFHRDIKHAQQLPDQHSKILELEEKIKELEGQLHLIRPPEERITRRRWRFLQRE